MADRSAQGAIDARIDSRPPAGTRRDGRILRCVLATTHAATVDVEAVRQAASAVRSIDDNVGVVLLTSDGPNFCTGGDVGEFAAAEDPSAVVGDMARTFHDFILALAHTPVPVVAGVPGWAAGAGMSLVCVADISVGGPSTRFRPAYPSIGFSPDGGMTWTLPRAVGASVARDIILTDAALTGSEAHRLGLLTRLVPDDDVRSTTEMIAQALAKGPTASYMQIKRLLREATDRSLAQQLDAEADAIAVCASSPDGREGVAAFIQRRAARFGSRSSGAFCGDTEVAISPSPPAGLVPAGSSS